MDSYNEMGNEISIKNSYFVDLISEINRGLLIGDLDNMCYKLKDAIDFYVDNNLEIPVPNIFHNVSNILEGFTEKSLLIEQLIRIIDILVALNNTESLSVYYRYYALALALYGSVDEALEIIEKAEILLADDTESGLFIEIQNAKAIIFSYSNRAVDSLEIFQSNFEKSKRINYTPGYRFAQNIGYAYREIGDYENAVINMKIGLDLSIELGLEMNIMNGMLELAETYIIMENYNEALTILKKVSGYEILTSNLNFHRSFCKSMYETFKKTGKYQEALSYHETFLSLSLLLKPDDNKEVHSESNYEIISNQLNTTNKFLKTTLKKAHEIQHELLAKNQELEATMEDLHLTQEKLLTAEKHTILDGLVINIAEHMNTPLGVMNTTTSYIKNFTEKNKQKYLNSKLSKSDLEKFFDEISRSSRIYEESMYKVINFIDAMKHYKVDDSDESSKMINVSDYLAVKLEFWRKIKGLDDVVLHCDKQIEFEVKVSLLDKCLELIIEKILKATNRNGFDIEVSEENNIILIGLGDFKSHDLKIDEDIPTPTGNTYDYYIIQTIIEDLLRGRFIKFEESGREYYQFIFPKQN